MSHFCVLVIGKDYKKLLAPYQENNMSDCPPKFLKFIDIEDEYRKKYKKETVTMVIMPDGRNLFTWDDEFRVKNTIGIGGESHKVPEHLKKKEVKVSKIHPDFDQYMKVFCGYKKDKKKKRYGYWENPNAKWDWCLLGGRWTGFFKLKPGRFGDTGSPGLMTTAASPGYADQATKKDIDFNAMEDEAESKALERWQKVEAATKGIKRPEWTSWEFVREKLHKGNIEKARETYNHHPYIDAISRAGFHWSQDEFLVSKEEYLQNARCQAFVPFALLYKGKWHDRGEMGWFGVVHKEKDIKKWIVQFKKLLDELPENSVLSLVDCHI